VIMLRLGQIGNEEKRPTCRASLVMAKRFRRGDRVSWNSEAGRVRGRIVKVHTKDVNYKGYVHHASKENPQYEIKSDKTDHVALHKASALRRIRR
jgi:Hypervirulence associated proteins TUDOR domain